MTQDPFLRSDAAYVLGILDDADRIAFETHLRSCPDCQARVAEMRPTAALLAGLSLDAVADAPPMPDTLLPGLLHRARRERTRRRVLTSSVLAVAAACVAALVAVLWPGASSPQRPAVQAFAAVRPSPVTATARLVPRAWGTEIDVECHYAAGGTSYVPYDLVVVDKERHRYQAGSWTLAPGRAMHFTGGIAVKRSEIGTVQITLADGTAILRLSA